MKSWFRIDYYKLVRLMLPTLLRRPLVIATLESLVSPVDWLYGLFVANRNANLYHLDITPQVCYLEKALNDRFDLTDRRIFITAGKIYERQYLYTRAEAVPAYIRTRGENGPAYLHTRRETGAGSYDFIVNVPVGLKYDRSEMFAFVTQYKLASKIFDINEF